jgi:hypothetical protein
MENFLTGKIPTCSFDLFCDFFCKGIEIQLKINLEPRLALTYEGCRT